MSELYNSSITTRLIDPVFDRSKFRSEFRLMENTAFLSNWRLLDVGISSNPTQRLNPLLGSYGCIKSVQLYDGNQLLDQLLEASIYNAFKNVNNTNDANISLGRDLKNNDLGYVVSGNQTDQDRTIPTNSVKVRVEQGDNNSDFKSWVSISDMLSFLKRQVTIPTNVYKNLRLVINWKSAEELKNLVEENRTHALSTYENTVLVVDEMNPSDAREAVMNNYQGVMYRPVEHDSYELPKITGTSNTNVTVPQTVNQLVNGFNGKTLHNLLIVQTPQDSSNWIAGDANKAYANQGSQSLYKSKYQVRVNGANKLSRDGWTGHNQRLGQLVDTYGECNLIMGQNQTFLQEGSNYIYDPDTMGQLDYTGLEVKDSINELQIEVSRSGVVDDPKSNQRIRMNLFGEVDKQVVMRNDGRYNVVYA